MPAVAAETIHLYNVCFYSSLPNVAWLNLRITKAHHYLMQFFPLLPCCMMLDMLMSSLEASKDELCRHRAMLQEGTYIWTGAVDILIITFLLMQLAW